MNIEIANKLVKLRKKHNLSQEELASKLGLSRQAISKWERAESSPDTDNLISLAKLYNISLDELLLTSDDNDDYNNTNDYNDEDIGDIKIYHHKDSKVVKVFRKNGSFWALFPYPLFITILFFVIGIVFNKWSSTWLLFLTIPLYYSLVSAINNKNIYHFSYPVLVVIVYLFISIVWNQWAYSWILFITIPLYYGIIDAYRKSKRHK